MKLFISAILMMIVTRANSEDYSKGFLGFSWGTSYDEVMKKGPPLRGDSTNCPSFIQKFPPNTNMRKYIDEKNIFPKLKISSDSLDKDRSDVKKQNRYKLVNAPILKACYVFFDAKYMGLYMEAETNESYQEIEKSFLRSWGKTLQVNSDCDSQCTQKYRVYHHEVGDTDRLLFAFPFHGFKAFIYSKIINRQIQNTLK